MTAGGFKRHVVEKATVMSAYMPQKLRGRMRHVAAGLCVVTAMAGASGMLLSADASIRLLGVSSEAGAIVIEASEPVAYAVSSPDAWTVVLDLRNVSVDGATNTVDRASVANVTLEQKTAVDGRAVARVRLSLARPAEYRVRSARNTIRVELSAPRKSPIAAPAAAPRVPAAPRQTTTATPTVQTEAMPKAIPKATPTVTPTPKATGPVTAAAPVMGMASPVRVAGTATVLDRVQAAPHADGIAITLGGDGLLAPANVTESRDLPRRLVLDFLGIRPKAAPRTAVSGDLVREVRVAINSHDPLVTRVVIELASGVTYHVQHSGANSQDLTVVFAPPQVNGVVMLAPADVLPPAADPEPPLTIEQALANAASLTPTDVPLPDPFSALQIGTTQTGPPPDAPAAVRQNVAPAAQPQPRPAPQSQPRPAPQPAAVATRQSPAPQPQQTAAPQPVATQQTPAQPPAAPPARQVITAQSVPPPQSVAPQRSTEAPAPNIAQQQISAAQEKKYSGHPITMDFQGVDLRSVLRTFAEISGLNMVIDPDVQGTVDMILTEVPWDQALEVILRGNSLDYTVDGTIVRVARIDTLKKEQDARQQLAKSSADAGTLAVRTFSLSYAKAAQAAPLVKRAVLSPRGDVQIDERTNMLIITDLPARLETVSQLLNTLDRAEPQVEVEARVVQTTREFAQAVGIQWGLNGRVAPELGNTPPLAFPNRGTLGGRTGNTQGPTGDPRAGGLETASNAINLAVPGASSAIGLALGSINGAFNLDVALSALERSGKGRILSTPRLTTQNNIEAEVAQGIQIPIQTVANNTVTVSFKDAVLVLKVTPQITTAGTVIMKITIENATADFSRQINGIPPIDTQRAITTVQINDGATTIIGGIFVSQEQIANERTPVLHRIPLLGWLFRRDSQTDQSRELLIFITPRILKG